MKKKSFEELFYLDLCGCGDKQCGKLAIHIVGRNVIDIGFIPYRNKKIKFGVVISDEQLKRFRDVVIRQKEFDDNFKEQ